MTNRVTLCCAESEPGARDALQIDDLIADGITHDFANGVKLHLAHDVRGGFRRFWR